MNAHEKMLWPDGLKKTKQRLEIFETLCKSQRPVDVQELSALLERRGNPMWPSTIYRVLDTLLAHGIIQKTAVHESGMAVYELGDSHRHYAICVGCKQILAIQGCPLDGFLPELQDENFHVLSHSLQISGYCGECRRKNSSD